MRTTRHKTGRNHAANAVTRRTRGALEAQALGASVGYFQTLSQMALAQRVAAARSCVVFAAPGITPSVATALASIADRIGARNVVVVIDASANVARMGYGDFATFGTLTAAGIQPRQQSGLRQSLLIVDNAGWAFTMRPELLEQDAVDGEPAPNAIALTTAQVAALRGELPQPAVVADAAPHDAVLPVSVGEKRISPEEAQEIRTDLEIAPPQTFDLQRQVSIYISFVRFVELKMEGWRVERRKVQLPASLPVLATRDSDISKRIRSTLRILEDVGDGELRALRDKIDRLRNEYCQSVGQLGRIILRSNQAVLEAEVARIEERIGHAKEKVAGDIEAKLEAAVEALVPEFAAALLANPTDGFRGRYGLSQSGAEDFVRHELQKVFPTAEKITSAMRVTLVFKDVTHEMLKDQDFKDRVLTRFHESALPRGLLEEYRGACARRSAADSTT